MSKIDEVLDRILSLEEKKAEEYKKLAHSLALRKAVPNVFSDGAAKVHWDSDSPHYWPDCWAMTVTKGNGEQIKVNLRDHLNASWIESIRKPINWNRNPNSELRLWAKQKAERKGKLNE